MFFFAKLLHAKPEQASGEVGSREKRIITSWFAIALDEIRTRRFLREKADCKQSIVDPSIVGGERRLRDSVLKDTSVYCYVAQSRSHGPLPLVTESEKDSESDATTCALDN